MKRVGFVVHPDREAARMAADRLAAWLAERGVACRWLRDDGRGASARARAFAGDLDRNRREELMLRLTKTLGKKEGIIRLQPVCTRDLALAKEVVVEPS